MSGRAWNRVPREDFERYLGELMASRPSKLRVRRLARKLRLLGWNEARPQIYDELAKTGDQDLTNLVLAELRRPGGF